FSGQQESEWPLFGAQTAQRPVSGLDFNSAEPDAGLTHADDPFRSADDDGIKTASADGTAGPVIQTGGTAQQPENTGDAGFDGSPCPSETQRRAARTPTSTTTDTPAEKPALGTPRVPALFPGSRDDR